MKEIRVLILSTALSGGGAEAVTKLMVDQLTGSACALFENDANVALPGHEIRVIRRWPAKTLFGVLVMNFWRLMVIQFIKLQLRPTVTISHLEGPNLANILTVGGGKRILYVHNQIRYNYQEKRSLNRLIINLVRIFYHQADRIVAVSLDVRSELIDTFSVKAERVIFIPNPIDPPVINAASNIAYEGVIDRLLSERYLINIASLSLQKNQQFLLRIFGHLVKCNDSYRNIKLVLVGGGDRRQSLLDLAAELDLRICETYRGDFDQIAQVYFTGFQHNPYPLLRHADLLVMTSLWEGLPISLLEAMSLGIPSVISDCSTGIRSVWQVPSDEIHKSSGNRCQLTEYGALINSIGDDSEAIHLWAETIKRFLNDTELYKRCSAASRTRSQDYEIEKVADLWRRELSDLG